MVFQFEHVGLDHGPGGKWDYKGLDLRDLKTSWSRWQKGLAETGWNSLYLNNHDQPRLVSRFGNDGAFRYESATLWAALLHLHRGTPYIYQGEEIGMTNAPFETVDDFRDIESINHFYEATGPLGHEPGEVLRNLRIMSRDNARTPVQWTAEEQAGFTSATPWIAVNPNYPSINADTDRAAERSVFRFYQQLIELRHKDETVRLGRFAMLAEDHPTLYAFTRTHHGTTLLVVGNVSGSTLILQDEPSLTDSASSGTLVLGNYDEEPTPELRPWEVRILRIS
jgi:oligo-1,6-glucosidase